MRAYPCSEKRHCKERRWWMNVMIAALLGTILTGSQGKMFAAEGTGGGVASSADAVCALKVGMTAPKVEVTSLDGSKIDLSVEIAKKPTVLVFYRGGWCPCCNTQLRGLREIESKLYDIGYQLLAVCADKPEKLKETLGKDSLRYTLLSDAPMTAAAFGLAFKVDDITLKKYKGFGIDLEGASGQTHHVLPVPAVYLFGTDGIVRFSYVNPNYKIRLDPYLLLAAAESALKEQ
jgi:peroxiredoxin